MKRKGKREEGKEEVCWLPLTPPADLHLTGPPTHSWVVAGASKRGWTTWMVGSATCASCPKIAAIAPLVPVVPDIAKEMHAQFRSYGGWTFAFQDYYVLNLTAKLNSELFQQGMAIINPTSYPDRLKELPKLVVLSSDDEFLQFDWTQLCEFFCAIGGVVLCEVSYSTPSLHLSLSHLPPLPPSPLSPVIPQGWTSCRVRPISRSMTMRSTRWRRAYLSCSRRWAALFGVYHPKVEDSARALSKSTTLRRESSRALEGRGEEERQEKEEVDRNETDSHLMAEAPSRFASPRVSHTERSCSGTPRRCKACDETFVGSARPTTTPSRAPFPLVRDWNRHDASTPQLLLFCPSDLTHLPTHRRQSP